MWLYLFKSQIVFFTLTLKNHICQEDFIPINMFCSEDFLNLIYNVYTVKYKIRNHISSKVRKGRTPYLMCMNRSKITFSYSFHAPRFVLCMYF